MNIPAWKCRPTRFLLTATFSFGRFELLPARRQLLLDGQAVAIGARAFDVLHALIERRERLVTKEELLDLAWPGLVVEENNLQVQVSSLRKILGPDAIITIPGRGYRFTVTVRPASSQSFLTSAKDIAPIGDNAPSIAVLPFTDLSPEKDQEYFADGLAEELLNVLSKIRGLRVASRTSAFSFKGSKVDIPTVAQKLNVTTVLEGSVRKAGKRVRITAQLVQVATDSHLWSETYERELEDIFAVQDDIARSVVNELRAMLLGEKIDATANAEAKAEVQAAAKGRGENAEAYRLYLQARFFEERSTEEDIAKAIDYYGQALEIDPAYALAWAGLAHAYATQGAYYAQDVDQGFRKGREAAERALQLEPDLAEAHEALGRIHMWHDWDWQAADVSFRRALELAPGSVLAMRGGAEMLAGCLGRPHEAIGLFRRALTFDPLNASTYLSLAVASVRAGDLAGAEIAAKKGIELNPKGDRLHWSLGIVRLMQGRLDEALKEIEQEGSVTFRLQGLAIVHHARGRTTESDAALRQLIEISGAAFQIAEAYAYRGNADAAFEWLERAYAQRDAGIPSAKQSAFLRNIQGDLRCPPFLEKLGLAD